MWQDRGGLKGFLIIGYFLVNFWSHVPPHSAEVHAIEVYSRYQYYYSCFIFAITYGVSLRGEKPLFSCLA